MTDTNRNHGQQGNQGQQQANQGDESARRGKETRTLVSRAISQGSGRIRIKATGTAGRTPARVRAAIGIRTDSLPWGGWSHPPQFFRENFSCPRASRPVWLVLLNQHTLSRPPDQPASAHSTEPHFRKGTLMFFPRSGLPLHQGRPSGSRKDRSVRSAALTDCSPGCPGQGLNTSPVASAGVSHRRGGSGTRRLDTRLGASPSARRFLHPAAREPSSGPVGPYFPT